MNHFADVCLQENRRKAHGHGVSENTYERSSDSDDSAYLTVSTRREEGGGGGSHLKGSWLVVGIYETNSSRRLILAMLYPHLTP